MIKDVVVINESNEQITLPISSSRESGFYVKSITGIGPAKATLNTVDLVGIDGALENTRKLNFRNIVMSLGFYDDPAKGINIEDIRIISYKIFNPKREVTLIFHTDRKTLQITGRVESNEPSIFDKDESCQVSILCYDPYFKDPERNRSNLYGGLDARFEFIMDVPYATLINFGEYSIINDYTVEKYYYYPGDAETGVNLEIRFEASVSNTLEIRNVTRGERMVIDMDRLLRILQYAQDNGVPIGVDRILPRSIIKINTSTFEKSITLHYFDVSVNILDALVFPTDWIKLSPGENQFVFISNRGNIDYLKFLISSSSLYGGV